MISQHKTKANKSKQKRKTAKDRGELRLHFESCKEAARLGGTFRPFSSSTLLERSLLIFGRISFVSFTLYCESV